MACSSGFSLVELMIVGGLTAVVLAGLGALILVSDVKVGRRSDSMQEAQEQWGRAVTFIQNEVADAANLSATLGNNSYPCGLQAPSPITQPTTRLGPSFTVSAAAQVANKVCIVAPSC